MSRLNKVFGLVALLWSGWALAQVNNPGIAQSGSVTPSHLPCWVTSNVVQDCGLATSAVLSPNGPLTVLPASLGTLDRVTIGGSVPAAGTFTSLSSTSFSSTSINSTPIGNSVPSSAAFTTLSAGLANSVTIGGTTTPFISTAGTSNTLNIGTVNGMALQVAGPANTVDYLSVYGQAIGGSAVSVGAKGGDTNVGLSFQTQGSGILYFQPNGNTSLASLSGGAAYLIVNGGATTSSINTNVGNITIGSAGGTTTLSDAAVTLSNITTGTNADVLCVDSGKVIRLQAAASCTISSKRFKIQQGQFSGDAMAELNALGKPVLFTLKDGASNPDPNASTQQIGFYAEDVATVDPRLALYEIDMKTPKSYRQDGLLALTVGAAQQHDSEIAELRQQIRITRIILAGVILVFGLSIRDLYKRIGRNK